MAENKNALVPSINEGLQFDGRQDARLAMNLVQTRAGENPAALTNKRKNDEIVISESKLDRHRWGQSCKLDTSKSNRKLVIGGSRPLLDRR